MPNPKLICLLPLFVLAACGDADTSDTSTTGEETRSTTSTTSGTTTAPDACDGYATGAYDFNGDSFGMDMSATLTMDEADCSFTLDGWNMTMAAPTGGTIDGDVVTFTGDGIWPTCTGTKAALPLAVLCTENNTTFEMRAE